MPILNYTTEIPPKKTAHEIQGILAAKGAQRVSVDYDNAGEPIAIEFMIQFHSTPVWYRLPCNVPGVYRALQRQNIERRYKSDAQAQRVAWRIVKDWIEAQLAIVEANQAEMAEVFLPYALDSKGNTFFQAFSQQKQLTAADNNQSAAE